jgi:hypothetical protein
MQQPVMQQPIMQQPQFQQPQFAPITQQLPATMPVAQQPAFFSAVTPNAMQYPGVQQSQTYNPFGVPSFPAQIQAPVVAQQQVQPSTGDILMQVILALITGLVSGNFGKKSEDTPPVKQNLPGVEMKGRVWGDPHYEIENADGSKTTTDHTGAAGETNTLLDTKNGDGLTVDARYAKCGDTATVMDQITVKAGDQSLVVNKDGSVKLGDKTLEKGTTMILQDGTEIVVDKDGKVTVNSKEKDASLTITDQGEYLDLGFDGTWNNGTEEVGGLIALFNKNNANLKAVKHDINGDGKADDTNGDGFLDNAEVAAALKK